MAEFDNLPDPAQFEGKTATDNTTGALLFSDGLKWIPMEPVGGLPRIDTQPGFGTEDLPSLGTGADIGAGIARHGVAPMIIPGALELGAAAATPFVGPLGPAMIPFASFTGELINQQVGITEKSKMALAAAFAFPMFAQGGASAIRAGKGFLFPGRAAALLNEMGEQEARKLILKFKPDQAFRELFEGLSEEAILVAPKTMGFMPQLLNDLKRIDPSAFAKEIRTIQRIVNKFEGGGGRISPADMQAMLEVLGTRVSQVKGGKGLGALKATEEALFDDIEAMIRGSVGNLSAEQSTRLMAARRIYSRTKTVDRLDEAISAAFSPKRGSGEVEQFNPQQVIAAMKRDKFFRKVMDPAEQREIFTVLKKINRIPVLPPGTGVPFGSGGAMRGMFRGTVVGTAAGAAGQAVGLPVTPQMGAAIGALSPPVTRTIRDMALAMQFEEGRRLVWNLLLNTDGAYTPQIASLVGAFLAHKFATTEKGQETPAPLQMLGG